MKKLLFALAVIVVTASSAMALVLPSQPNYQTHKWIRFAVNIGSSTLTVNVYQAGVPVALGDSDAAPAQAGDWTNFGSQSRTAGYATLRDNGGARTYLGINLVNSLVTWHLTMATNNETFTDADRGGMILGGAITGEPNKVAMIWKTYADRAGLEAEVLTDAVADESWIQDYNNANWVSGSMEAGYACIANGGTPGQSRNNGGTVTAPIVANEFFLNMSAFIDNENEGYFFGYPNIVLFAN